MKVWVISGILFANILVQSVLLPFLEIYHTKPDTLLAVVVSFALTAGNPTAATIGFFGGLMQDILFGRSLGIFALLYMLVGYVIGLVYEKVYVDKLILPVFFVISGLLLRQVGLLVYCFFAKIDISVSDIFFKITMPETIYTAFIMPLIYFLINKLYRYKFMSKKWSFRQK